METLPREVVSVSKYEIEPFNQGRRVGCYLLGRTLGEGSFAKVKEGLHIITGEKVAVKIIDKKRAREDRYISKNLRREARIHQLVRHPNIIQLYEVLETDHYYYLIMEYSDGGELLDYICTRKRLDENVAKRLVSQLVSSVDGMHKSGVVHRDLKIENFLLNDNEDLKIIDFGLSNTLSQGCMSEYERTGIFPQMLNTHCGSPAYAAPELLAQKKYGPQVDVWSIGINMYAMLTGFLPYMMEPFNVMEMYEKMMQRKMTPVPSFLSQACRDLLMRLLEPVAEWRITLKQVMRHKWFTGSEHIPRSIPLGDMMYQKKELCEPVLAYMKYTLKIRTKDAINAVVSNRAVHASAVYHLLVARLDRYLKHKKDKRMAHQFAKLEIIKKSSLSTENVHAASTTNRSKRFTFRGKKIDSTSRSQPNLAYDDEDEHIIELITQNQLDKLNSNEYNKEDKRERTRMKSSNSEDCIKEKVVLRPTRGHKRSNSSINSKELRKSQEVQDSIRKSLISDSQEDLGKFIEQEKKKSTESPKDPFPKSEKNNIVSRKQSCDVVGGIDVLESPNSDKIDVTKFVNENVPRRDSNDKQATQRKGSMDVFDLNEPKTKEEQKEPVPGWHITKVVKQPPLKEEHTHIRETENKIDGTVAPEPKYESKRRVVRTISGTEKSKSKRTIRVVESEDNGSQQQQKSSKSQDCNNNEEDANDESFSTVSDRVKRFTEKRKQKKANTSRSHTPEVEEILRNVRSINREHLAGEKKNGHTGKITDIDRLLSTPESGEKWKAPDKETIENIHDSKTRIRRVIYMNDSDSSTLSNTPSPPLTKEAESYSTDSPEVCDENNNNEVILAKVRKERSVSVDRGLDPQASNISPIKTITTSKKTLELNVKQFTQFKSDSITSPENEKSGGGDAVTTTTTHHHTQLKPLQLKFNFQVRKKKAYKEKQQTRSLTDISQGVSAKPTEEQMLSPKHRCTENCNVNNGHCTEKQELDHKPEDATQKQSVRKTLSCGEAQPIKRTTIKISSHRNSNVGNSISSSGRRNRAKVYIASNSPRTSVDDDERVAKKEIRNEELNSNNSSFDSGYFGTNNPSPPMTDETSYHHGNNNTFDVKSKRTIERQKSEPLEIHSVKYRCIPVYQPEIVKTGTLYSKESLSVISEDDGSIPLHKKWGSQTIEPTQEPVDYVPRSAVLINSIKEKFQQERAKKMDLLTKDRPINEKRALNRTPSTEIKHARSTTCKQYAIEKTVVGAKSPRFHTRASYGVVNNNGQRGVSTPRNSPSPSPSPYENKIAKSKVSAFAHALENAAWRKKTVAGH